MMLLIMSNSYTNEPKAIFGLNFIVPLPVLAFAFWKFRKDKKYNEQLIRESGFLQSYRIKFKYNTFQYTIIGFYLITSLVISYLLITDSAESNLLITLVMIIFYSLLIVIFPIGRLTEHDLLQQIHSVEKKSTMDSDNNDEAIVLLETQLN